MRAQRCGSTALGVSFYRSFLFYRRNSIGYDVDIVFRLCFCDSKNTIYFVGVIFLHTILLKRNTLTVFVAAS